MLFRSVATLDPVILAVPVIRALPCMGVAGVTARLLVEQRAPEGAAVREAALVVRAVDQRLVDQRSLRQPGRRGDRTRCGLPVESARPL